MNARQLLAARTGAWAKSGAPLPYLRKVAYLESHGTEWIETGIVLNENRSVTCVCSIGGPDQCPFGSRYAAYDRSFMCFYGIGGTSAYFSFGNLNIILNGAGIGESYGKKVVLHVENGNFYVKYAEDSSVIVESSEVATWTGVNEIHSYLFAANQNNSVNRRLNGRIYGAEFHGIAKFIPVLDMDGIPCMYDETNGVGGMNRDGTPRNDGLYYNRGTGTFGYGELTA